MIAGILVVLPIRTESPNRVRGLTRGARMGIAKKAKVHKSAAALAVAAHVRARSLTGAVLAPVVVKLTRISAGRLDTDNLASALKATRDGVALALGIDDGDVDRIRFVYAQRKGKRREYGVEVLIEHEARGSECRRLGVQREGGSREGLAHGQDSDQGSST